MKKILAVLFLASLLGIVGLSAFATADDQPALLNHQFYGEVFWAQNSVAPAVITATVEGASFSSEIRSSPCLEDPCKGRYGFDADNTLRVQGTEGEIISFLIDGIVAGEHIYKNDDVTQLDFDLRAEVKKIEPATTTQTAPTVNISETNETAEELPVQEPVEEIPKPAEVKEVPPVKIPDFRIPATPEVRKAEPEKGFRFNLYLISGIVLIVAAIGIIAYVVWKKKQEAEVEEI